MKANNIITALSGILFILSGIVILVGIKVPMAIDFVKLVGIALVVIGIGVLSGASLVSSLTLALSLITLLFSLSSSMSFMANNVINKFNVTYEGCKSFEVKVLMSDLKVILHNRSSEAFGSAVKREIGKCRLYVCCGKGKLVLRSKDLTIYNVLGNVYINAYKCLREVDVENYMGNVHVFYEVPKNCSGSLTIFTNMGNVRINLIVPKGVKVEYEISSNLGSYEVLLPNGKSKNEGTYGNGQNVLRVWASINMGSFKLTVGEGR